MDRGKLDTTAIFESPFCMDRCSPPVHKVGGRRIPGIALDDSWAFREITWPKWIPQNPKICVPDDLWPCFGWKGSIGLMG